MSRGKLVSRILKETEYPAWDQFVTKSNSGSVYSRPAYLETLCEVAGGKYRILAVFKGEKMVGGMGLYEVSSRLGRYLSNRMLLYYNGLILDHGDLKSPASQTSQTIATTGLIEEFLAGQKYARLAVRNRHSVNDLRVFLSRGWSVVPGYSYVVSIDDLEVTWKRMDQNLKRLVNRARDEGIVLTCDDDFDSFYELHYEVHKRKGSPLYLPRSAFQHYFRRLSDQKMVRLFHARLKDGQAIATQLVLADSHHVAHTVCAAAHAKHLRTGATPFLRWMVFEELSRSGYRATDLTDAYLNDVTRFKSQLGGNLVTNLIIIGTPSVLTRAVERSAALLRRFSGRLRRVFGGVVSDVA